MSTINDVDGRERVISTRSVATTIHASDTVSDPTDAAGQPPETFDSLYIRRPRVWLVAVLFAFVIAALSYAINTPAWQSPDEPAHYNYIAHIALEHSLPALQMGDYDQPLLDALLRSRFRSEQMISLLRYEYHQPPLYYLLATPVFWVSNGSPMALRLFSILIGVCTILLLYLCLELVFPTKTLIVVGGTAFAALLPMHVSVLASVNNDGLAEMFVMASMLALLAWMRRRFYCASANAQAMSDESIQCHRQGARRERSQLLLLGLLLGLGMLTKVYSYVLTPILIVAVVTVVWMEPVMLPDRKARRLLEPSWASFWSGVRLSLWAAVPAAVMASVWWIRNWMVYDGFDFLGLVQHGRVVAAQPRTLDWIAVNGWIAYSERAFSFTFQSFWGVFGWMGVFMDQRVYTAFLLFTGVIFLGVLWAVVRLISGRPDADMDLFQLWVLSLFGVIIMAVLVAYLWYNVEFVQHQGRYFFWGLLPIGTVVALGWREVMQPLQGAITAALTVVVAAGLVAVGTATGSSSNWTVLMTGAIAMALLLQPVLLAGTSEGMLKRLPTRLQDWTLRPTVASVTRWMRTCIWATPFVLMFVLNLLVPYMFIIPQLAR